MATTIVCKDCGVNLDEPKGPCPHCGGRVEVSVKLTGIEIRAYVGQVGTLVDEVTAACKALRNTSPMGIRSEISVDNSCVSVRIAARPAGQRPDVGRAGESRVAELIKAQLASAGFDVSIEPGNDNRGEDRILRIAGAPVDLQVVTVPTDERLWRPAGGEISATIPDVREWMRVAIVGKADKYARAHRSGMILALDIGHAGLLGTSAFSGDYLREHGDPQAEFGFRSVWLVGPIEKYCRPLRWP